MSKFQSMRTIKEIFERAAKRSSAENSNNSELKEALLNDLTGKNKNFDHSLEMALAEITGIQFYLRENNKFHCEGSRRAEEAKKILDLSDLDYSVESTKISRNIGIGPDDFVAHVESRNLSFTIDPAQENFLEILEKELVRTRMKAAEENGKTQGKTSRRQIEAQIRKQAHQDIWGDLAKERSR